MTRGAGSASRPGTGLCGSIDHVLLSVGTSFTGDCRASSEPVSAWSRRPRIPDQRPEDHDHADAAPVAGGEPERGPAQGHPPAVTKGDQPGVPRRVREPSEPGPGWDVHGSRTGAGSDTCTGSRSATCPPFPPCAASRPRCARPPPRGRRAADRLARGSAGSGRRPPSRGSTAHRTRPAGPTAHDRRADTPR